MTDSTPPLLARPALWPFQAVVGVLLALKLVYFSFAPPIGDEAYYWLWGATAGAVLSRPSAACTPGCCG